MADVETRTEGEENKKYKRIDFTKIKTIDDIKLIMLSMYGEVALNPENPRFKEVERRGLMSEEEFSPTISN